MTAVVVWALAAVVLACGIACLIDGVTHRRRVRRQLRTIEEWPW